MDRSVLTAIARCPNRARAIEEFAGRDEDFRSLCADLADADAALKRWQQSTSQLREERCTEYRDLISDLANEIGCVLDRCSKP